MSLKNWSTTAASNATVDSINFAEGQAPSSLNDSARALMADVRAGLYTKGSDIASATTTDLAAATTEGLFHDITGTTTITGLGTVGAGVWKVIKFNGALTLTHNATSLILPGNANITTVAGDIGIFVSEGSGNWRCVNYQPKNLAIAGAGVWTTPTYASGNFTASGSMTWTVDAGDVVNFQYTVINKTMIFAFRLDTTTVAGTPSTDLKITIPGGYTAAKNTFIPMQYIDNGTRGIGVASVLSGTVIVLQKTDLSNWTASTNNSYFFGEITFEIA